MANDDVLASLIAKADPAVRERAERRAQEIADMKRVFMRDAWVALEFNGISGDYAEFGCYGGLTMRLAHEQIAQGSSERHMWAFDSFEGLPEAVDERDQHPAWIGGSMAMDVDTFRSGLEESGVPAGAYTTVAGYFADTLPRIGEAGAPAEIALAYVDCDMYSSTATVLDFLAPRLKHGMIVAFDDWNCWSPTALSGERAALLEFLRLHPQWHFERFRDIGWGGTAFVVEDAALLTP